MKLRELVANSLPRVRGKKKKSQQVPGSTSTPKTNNVASSASSSSKKQLSSPTAIEPDGNGNWFPVAESRFSFWDRLLGKESSTKVPSRGHREQNSCFHDQENGQEQQRLDDSASSSSALGLGSPDYSSDLLNSSLASLGGSDFDDCGDLSSPRPLREWCEHDCDLDSTCGYSSGHGCLEDLTPAGLTSSGQKAPRSRSRIRTNPWLPSPRPSPYSVRSLSFPCSSSRSSSSSPSPSTSDNVSPLTSPSEHVPRSAPQQSRRRRHRPHHSEVRAAAFVASLPTYSSAECEQYYSTLDSGIGEVLHFQDHIHYDVKDNSRNDNNTGFSRKSESKRWNRQWDLDSSSYNNLNTIHSTSTPGGLQQTKVIRRSQQLPGEYGTIIRRNSYGCEFETPLSPAVGNRNSKAWDSDSQEDNALSPSVSICALTSNIEQLAHNISYEYEDTREVALATHIDGSCRPQMKDRLVPDKDFSTEPSYSCRSGLSMHDREVMESSDPNTSGVCGVERPASRVTRGLRDILGGTARTADVAVQTDFEDDDDEEEEDDPENDEINVLTNSELEWLTNASDGAAEGDRIIEDEDDAATIAAEAHDMDNKFWLMPDCMQDSTDTGYSSLSRECHNEIEDDDVASDIKEPDEPLVSRDRDTPVSTEAFDLPTAGLQGIELTSTSISSPETFRDSLLVDIQSTNDFLTEFGPFSIQEREKTAVENTGYCSCSDGFCNAFSNQRPRDRRRPCRLENLVVSDSIVPYPYDVTRFPDVMSHSFDPSFKRRSSPFEETGSRDFSEQLKFRRSSEGPDVFSSRNRDSRTRSAPCPRSSVSDVLPAPHQDNPRASSSPAGNSLPRCVLQSKGESSELSEHGLDLSLATGRSLREVTSSLEDKVFFLRQGKLLVQRKIREAREEEMLRQQHKLRLQRLLDIHRKQILLETLQDLRMRLESQSARLQASYSAVLNMQKSGAQHVPLDPVAR